MLEAEIARLRSALAELQGVCDGCCSAIREISNADKPSSTDWANLMASEVHAREPLVRAKEALKGGGGDE